MHPGCPWSGLESPFGTALYCRPCCRTGTEYNSPKAVWNALKTFFNKTDEAVASQNQTAITQFEFNDGMTVDVAWKTLKEFRRKVVGADATLKPAYTDKLLFNTLALKLPALFTPTLNGIKVASRIGKEFLPEEQIAMLAEVEAEDKAKNPTPNDEEAHFSRARGGRRPQSEQRGTRRFARYGNDASEVEGFICLLCGQPDHPVSACPALKFAKRLFDKYMARHRAKTQTGTHPDSEQSKTDRAHMAWDDSDSFVSSDASLDGIIKESAAFTKEDIRVCSLTPSDWPLDSGATSHMSDHLSRFRNLVPTNRRVKVGGGVLDCKRMGEVKISCPDGSEGWLRDALLVPNLGVSLVSLSKLCEHGLEGSFNKTSMQLLRENKIIVSASRTSNGLYMVEHVQPDRKGYVDTGTTATEKGLSTAESDDVLMDDIAVETSGTPDNTTAQTVDEESENGNDGDVLKSDVQRYVKYHNKFSHLGLRFLRNLHLVTDLRKRIKIPRELPICEVCKISKMRNRV
ncbi:uncharacterized protein CPUR_05441 [Claviceps purpurea 20.1]|uniref:Retrovirus-related Pol polyprotein from transposon TNT 1-94-like beta-barrel domain-containing protein n=1 Tax=Claviceps purpurea (strain 20.1) TaxID=1111077 RepID=M1WCG0_CLAP2|nr:uncharacterized protein CPUR_05441 [Claviceps purpurea 20.1]